MTFAVNQFAKKEKKKNTINTSIIHKILQVRKNVKELKKICVREGWWEETGVPENDHSRDNDTFDK